MGFRNETFWVDEVNTFVAVPESVALEALAPPLEADQPDDYEYELPDGCIELDSDEDTARRQLALMISDNESRQAPDDDGHNRFSFGHREFLVLTDSEADDAWDQELEEYIDECILYQLPENLQHYFDRGAWKRDARMDGRGHALSRYDGNEDYVDVDGETYYIFRQN